MFFSTNFNFERLSLFIQTNLFQFLLFLLSSPPTIWDRLTLQFLLFFASSSHTSLKFKQMHLSVVFSAQICAFLQCIGLFKYKQLLNVTKKEYDFIQVHKIQNYYNRFCLVIIFNTFYINKYKLLFVISTDCIQLSFSLLIFLLYLIVYD